MIEAGRVYTPPAICQETGAPRAMVYAALESGELRCVRRGTRYIASGSAVLAWLDELGAREAG